MGHLPENNLFGGKAAKAEYFEGIRPRERSQEQELEISRRGVQFLGLESLCSPSYEGLKVHVSQNTILKNSYIRLYTMHWHYVIAMAPGA